MTTKDMQPFVPFARGGEEKTVHEAELSPLLASVLEATKPAPDWVDVDSQSSVQGWAPFIIDTPGAGPGDFPASDDWAPKVPLPGPQSPNTN